MKKIRKTFHSFNLPTLRLEGSLFLPDMLESIVSGTAILQNDSDYCLPKGLKQKDEYSRAFQIASAQWKHFEKQMQRSDLNAKYVTANFVSELLHDVLAYPVVTASTGISLTDRHYPITHIASSGNGFLLNQIPIVLAPHTLGLDEADVDFAVRQINGDSIGGHSGNRKKSAFQLAQEFLNASPDHQWCLVTNGKTIRLLRDAATLTRPSYLDIDIADLLSGQRYAEFAYAWRILHASRAGLIGSIKQAEESGTATITNPLIVWESWREAGQEVGTRVRNGLRKGVTQALLTLGNGFLEHKANQDLRNALQNGQLKKEEYFAQLLRLIYRFIFLFSIEERGLLKDANGQSNMTYSQGYSMARLRDMSLRRRANNRFEDLWQSIRIVFKGLNLGELQLGLPALGGLFNPTQCSALDDAELSNKQLLEAIKSMRWAIHPDGTMAPIDYRNMGVEELGSVYESLLELVPELDLPARHFGFVGLDNQASTAGNERKLTGSYYTPDSLVQELIQSALVPVIEDRLNAQPNNPIEALLSIKVCDPACGSGHFLLAAARKLAERLAALRSVEGAVTPVAYRHALREVIAKCIFGVDRNPMAIELARTALWLEGYEEGRPLSFLDHHLQVGDALLGLTDLNVLEKGIPKDAFKALSGDDKTVCQELAKKNTHALKQMQKELGSTQINLQFNSESSLQALKIIESMPSDLPSEVLAKEQAYLKFLEENENNPVAHAADFLLCAFLSPKNSETLDQVPTSENLYIELSQLANDFYQSESQEMKLKYAQKICQNAGVFHWQLAFSQVFASGGFDCVLANPPWERIKLQEEEFFSVRHSAIAQAKNKSERSQRIQWLSEGMLSQHLRTQKNLPIAENNLQLEAEKRLYAEFIMARRFAEASSNFMHIEGDVNGQKGDGGRYPLTGIGDVNTYALFAETILQITAKKGRSGFIVPTGIATDDSTKLFFGHISQSGQLVSLYDIENRSKLFMAVDSRMKFSLITIGDSVSANFVCFATQPDQIKDKRRRFSLTPHEFQLINPNTLTCPMFRSERDAEITKKLYKASPVLIRDAVFDEVDGKKKIQSTAVNPWGISFSTMLDMSNDSHLFKDENANSCLPLFEAKLVHQFDHRWATYTQDGNSRDMTIEEKQDPHKTALPRYWIEQREVWLRVSNLPDLLLKPLIKKDEPAILLGLAWLLFGAYFQQNQHQPIFTAWQDFVMLHSFAQNLAPFDLGLCSKSASSQPPLVGHYLPAHGNFQEAMSTQQNKLAWHVVEASTLERYLKDIQPYMYLIENTPVLNTEEQAIEYAETLLEKSSPKWLMGWRDITNATNERTVISSVIPLAGVGHTMPIWFSSKSSILQSALLSNLNSLVLDYLARVKLGGTHLTYGYIKQFPIFHPDRYTTDDLSYIVKRVLELIYTTNNLADWAKDLGYQGPPFVFDPERRAILRAELDAYYARLYGLSRDELRYILDPADIMGKDYPSETFRVLKKSEIREFGEYRTQRLVLQAWDNLENIVIN